jgi:chromosome partitioning protein
MERSSQVISVIQDKGGAGKTTLLCALASLHAEAGAKVAIVDADPLKAAGDYASQTEKRLKEGKTKITIDYIHELDESIMVKTVRALQKKGYDVIFIDTAGVDSKSKDYAAQLGDLVLVPVKPSRADLKGMFRSINTIEGVSELSGRDIPYFVVLSDVDKTTRMTQTVLDALSQKNVPALQSRIWHRTGFKEFLTNGGVITGSARTVANELLAELQMKGLLTYFAREARPAA